MKFFLSFIITLIFTANCFATGPVKRKRVQLIPTYSYSHSNNYFDKQGQITPLGNNTHYVSHYLGLYSTILLSKRLDLLANIPIMNQRLTTNGVLASKTGIGDISLGVAYHFPSTDLTKFLTLKAVFIFPAYQNTTSPYLGYGEKAIQLGAIYSLNPTEKTYLAVEGNYTRYLDEVSGPTQYFISGTFGCNLNDFVYLTFNFSHQLSRSSDNSFNTNLAINKDFVLGKLSAAYGRRISRMVTPYAQLTLTPYGYNTGSSFSFSIYAIIKMP